VENQTSLQSDNGREFTSEIIKNIQALSTFKQNRLSQKLSKLSVALAGAEANISDEVMAQCNKTATNRSPSYLFCINEVKVM
jgi:CHASE3 domain sensor protein